jgi:formamidopyrimidine-DNA glycosylase
VPELPEIRAHAERLMSSHGDAILDDVKPLAFHALKSVSPALTDAVGNPLARVSARGKYLILEFGPTSHIVHLMQGGRLEPDTKDSAKPRGGLARWRFVDHPPLLLAEQAKDHRAGVWTVAGDPLAAELFTDLGPDADTVTRTQLGDLAKEHSMRVHGFLRRQTILAGIGRRLANEICFAAQLSPMATTTKLSAAELDRLHDAIGEQIRTGVDFERGQDHMVRSRERPAAVHHRAGEPCPRCADTLREVEYNAYVINYCATCQTGGRVLADNSTSKFLK